MTSHCKPQVSRSGKNLPHQINTHHRGRKSYAKQPRAINDRCTIQNVTSLKMYWNNVGGVDVDDSYPVRSYLSVETVRKELKFDPREPTFIMIHGYMGCKNVHRISYPNRLKHAIARHFSKANIFWVDWTHRSYDAFNYLGVTNELPLIAEEIDASLRLLEKAFPPFDRTNITVFGHSLGSHVAGNLGRVMDGKLDTIIGIGKI